MVATRSPFAIYRPSRAPVELLPIESRSIGRMSTGGSTEGPVLYKTTPLHRVGRRERLRIRRGYGRGS